MTTKPFELENRVFDAHRETWIRDGALGKWAAIHKETVIGVFDTPADAFLAAARQFKPGTFLVKQIFESDPIQTVQRVFWPTPEHRVGSR